METNNSLRDGGVGGAGLPEPGPLARLGRGYSAFGLRLWAIGREGAGPKAEVRLVWLPAWRRRGGGRLLGPGTVVLVAALLAVLSCREDEPAGGDQLAFGTTPLATPGTAAVATERAVNRATGVAPPEAEAPGGSGAVAAPTGIRHVPLTAAEFIDAPEHRDPFAPFVRPRPEAAQSATRMPQLTVSPIAAPQTVIFPDFDIEDLQCRMILALAGEKPRAYLVAPDGRHAYVRQGDLVGRSIRAGPTEPEVHWRVYEVHEGGVSFELSSATGDQGDTGLRPALRLYTVEEMRRFENLFSLR